MPLHPAKQAAGKSEAAATKALRASVIFIIFGLGAVVALGGGALTAVQCSASNAAHARAEKLLTPSELKTLRPAAGFCSDTYVFKRNGQDLCITAGSGGVGSCG